MSRHRGAEHCRRFGLLDNTSLFNLFRLDYIFTRYVLRILRRDGDGVLARVLQAHVLRSAWEQVVTGSRKVCIALMR